jgi:hypothetical protein
MTRIFKETENLDILTNYAEKIQEINNSWNKSYSFNN